MAGSPQELLNKICLMISAIESLYEEVLEIHLPRSERNGFLTWYGNAMEFLREERDILLLQQSSQFFMVLMKIILIFWTCLNLILWKINV